MKGGFDLSFPVQNLKAALVVSLLSVLVLIGLYVYLNRYTQRRYFAIWTVAWLFYALWLGLCISLAEAPSNPLRLMLKQWCIGTAAAFLLRGNIRFLRLPDRPRLFGLFVGFLLAWSYLGAYTLEDAFWAQLPIFALLGLASGVAGWCFWRLRRRRAYLGAGLLAAGFVMWGGYIATYPLLQGSEHLISADYFASAVLQLFIAVSMIILVLEEARQTYQRAVQNLQAQRAEAATLRVRADATEARYQRLFEQAHEGIVIAAPDDLRILECNSEGKRLLGINGQGGAPTCLPGFLKPDSGQGGAAQTASEWLGRWQAQPRVTLRRPDGSEVVAEISGALVDVAGRPSYQFFLRDLSERLRLEQQLRQAEKLSALGRMLSSVAHELSSPLAVVRGYLELVLARNELPAQTRADLDKAAQECNRAVKLVGGFLFFAKRHPAERRWLDLNALVRQVAELRKFDFSVTGAQWSLDLAPGSLPVLAPPDQLQQVLVNLITNALQAVEAQPQPRRVTLRTVRGQQALELQVEDNGAGVAEAAVPRLCEPFFTTKEGGTGLGLWIAQGILAELQGHISYRPAATGGACFVVELPLGQPPEPLSDVLATPTAALPRRPPALPLAVLVLDDEPSVARVLGKIVEFLGHHPTLNQDPFEALELAKTRDFGALIVDLGMPQMDGRQFFQALVQAKPHLASRVVFLSGGIVSEETDAFLHSVPNACLTKPFDMAEVQRVLETLSPKSAA
jgi:two-component system NtrC family sensor kinase